MDFSARLGEEIDRFPPSDDGDFILSLVLCILARFFNSEPTGTIQSKMREEQTIQFSLNYNHY